MRENWCRLKPTKDFDKSSLGRMLSSSLTEHRLFFQVRCCDRVRTGPHLSCTLIDLAILARRRAPGKIAAHPVSHQRLPRRRITVGKQRLFYRREQRLASVVGKFEARALAGTRIPRLDGVIKTAGRPHDGN